MSSIVTSYIPTRAGAVDTRTADSISWPFLAAPQAMSLYIRFQERGAITASVGGNVINLVNIGNSGVTTAAHLDVIAFSGFYRARFFTGIGAASAQAVAVSAPALGQIVEILVTLSAAGSLQITQAIQGTLAAAVTVSSTHPLPAAWNATTLCLTAVSGGNAGVVALLNLSIVRGVESFATMRRLASVS